MTRQLPPAPPVDDGFEDAAAWWTAQNSDGWDAAAAVRLEAWLAADPAHRQAFDEVGRAMALFDPRSGDPDLERLRGEAAALPPPRRSVDRRWLIGAGGALAAGLAAVAVVNRAPRTETYASPQRSRRSLALADGSRLDLDAATEVQVALSRTERRLTLVRGQARFEVAHDAARPFSVTVGRHQVVALGTVFNIDRLGDGCAVTLLEGRVQIRSGTSTLATLTPGLQFLAEGGAAPRLVRLSDPATATAWQGGRLVFDNQRLADAAARVNRYSQTRILLQDRALDDLRITGLFNAGDQAAFVEAITAYLPLTAERQANGDVVLRSRSRPGAA